MRDALAKISAQNFRLSLPSGSSLPPPHPLPQLLPGVLLLDFAHSLVVRDGKRVNPFPVLRSAFVRVLMPELS
jgi:hypothetical protein